MPLRNVTPIPIIPTPGPEFDNESLASSSPHAAQEIALDVRRIRQRRNNWCWAACVDMVLDYFGDPGLEQCTVVGKHIDEPCCNDPNNQDYDVSCEPEDMRKVWKQAGVTSKPHLGVGDDHGWVDSDILVNEINQGRPIQIGLKWNGQGGHALVVRGWRNTPKGPFFTVCDPWYWNDEDVPAVVNGIGHVHYDELRQAYGLGRWKWTWTNLKAE